MNMLKKSFPLRLKCTRLLESFSQSAPLKKVIVEPLEQRELIRVRGEETPQFLQGLITNDMKRIEKPATSMYALFLNKAGRLLYDTIIYHAAEPNTYIVECDKDVTNELKRHLRLYRVRRKIDVDIVCNEYSPWVIFNPADSNVNQTLLATGEWFFTPDPRLKELGLRVLMTPDRNWADLAKVFVKVGEVGINVPTADSNYQLHRYLYGVGEGIVDLPPGKCFALECNCDFLHGVSFQKGCYIGQELTARTFHTGVVRKRLMPIRLTVKGPPPGSPVQLVNGANVGTLRDSRQNRGLALMRVEQALNYNEFLIDGDTCYVEKPHWWPRELPHKAIVAR